MNKKNNYLLDRKSFRKKTKLIKINIFNIHPHKCINIAMDLFCA